MKRIASIIGVSMMIVAMGTPRIGLLVFMFGLYGVGIAQGMRWAKDSFHSETMD